MGEGQRRRAAARPFSERRARAPRRHRPQTISADGAQGDVPEADENSSTQPTAAVIPRRRSSATAEAAANIAQDLCRRIER